MSEEDIKISLIFPVCNEENSLQTLFLNTKEVLDNLELPFEFIFVDDGSMDNSLAVLREIQDKEDCLIEIIQFRRNFGKAAALSAGFEISRGEFVFTMDSDLQDDPEEIPRFIEKIEKGYDLVSGWKKNRKDPLIKILSSKVFNFTVSIISGLRLHDFNCGFKCYRSEVVKNIQIRGELHRLIPVMAHQMGFKVAEMEVRHKAREFGKSNYGKFGLRRVTNYLLDPVGIILLTKYAQKPAHFFGNIGLLSLFVGFLMNVYLTVLWLCGQRPIGNRPLLFLGILLVIVGVQLVSMGLLGEIIIQNKDKKETSRYIKKIYHKS